MGRLRRAGLCPGACWEGGVGLKAVGHLVDLCYRTVAWLVLGGVHGAQPRPERKRVSTAAGTLAAWVAAARLGAPVLLVSDLGHWLGPQSLG